MVARSPTTRKTIGLCPWGGSLPSGEREQVANICGDQEVVLGLELRFGGTRNREGRMEAKWVEEDRSICRSGCLVEGSRRQSHRQSEKNGRAGRLTKGGLGSVGVVDGSLRCQQFWAKLLCGCAEIFSVDDDGVMICRSDLSGFFLPRVADQCIQHDSYLGFSLFYIYIYFLLFCRTLVVHIYFSRATMHAEAALEQHLL